jgi:hypothetical protein
MNYDFLILNVKPYATSPETFERQRLCSIKDTYKYRVGVVLKLRISRV